MDAYGVVLCGGRGSRLRPLSYYIPKPMVPIGRREKPLLEYILRLMAFHGLKDVLLLVGYKGNQIKNYFRDGSFLGLKLSYAHDSEDFPGTGGAVLNALRLGLLPEDNTILIYYGDILSDINLGEMLKAHRSSGAVATLAVSMAYRLPVSVAELDGDRIARFEEKPALRLPVGIGILAVEGEALQHIANLYRKGRNLDLMRDFIPYLIKQGMLVKAYITDAFWYDVGSLEKYEKLDHDDVEKRLAFLFRDKDDGTRTSLQA